MLRNSIRNSIRSFKSADGGLPPFSFGNALQFDGVNDYVSFPTISLTDATISCWIKTRETGETFFISGNGIGNGGAYIAIRASNNLTYVRIGAVIKTFSFPSILTNTWYHCFIRFSLTGVRFYINGVESSTGLVAFSGTKDFNNFGRLWQTSNYYDFDLDELAIWNTDIGNESANLYNGGAGDYATNYSLANLLAYWRMNEADGSTTLVDEQGTYNGTLNNFSTPPAYFIPH